MTVSELRRLKLLEAENRRLKQIVAEQALDSRTLKELPARNLLTSGSRKVAVGYVVTHLWRSVRKACDLVCMSRAAYGFVPRRDRDVALRERLRELAQERRRFGHLRLHMLLRREGLVLNRKPTERLYREEGLALRRKARRKGAAGVSVMPSVPQEPNEKWARDFVSDSTADGRWFRALVVVDECARMSCHRG